MTNLDELKDLTPQERLKKLKEVRQRMQQEIEEAGKLVAKTEQELADEEFKREKLPIPQVTATDEDMLFTLEEKQIFRQARQQLGKSTKEELEQRTQLKGKKQQSKLEETAETARRMSKSAPSNTLLCFSKDLQRSNTLILLNIQLKKQNPLNKTIQETIWKKKNLKYTKNRETSRSRMISTEAKWKLRQCRKKSNFIRGMGGHNDI